MIQFKISAKTESAEEWSDPLEFSQAGECDNMITLKSVSDTADYTAARTFNYATTDAGTSEKLMAFDKFGLVAKKEATCPMECRITESGNVLDYDDDITFNNLLNQINAKQDSNTGYSRDIVVECTTNDYKSTTVGLPVKITQSSRCTKSSAFTYTSSSGTLKISKGWSATDKPEIDYGILSRHAFCAMSCEALNENGDLLTFGSGEAITIVKDTSKPSKPTFHQQLDQGTGYTDSKVTIKCTLAGVGGVSASKDIELTQTSKCLTTWIEDTTTNYDKDYSYGFGKVKNSAPSNKKIPLKSSDDTICPIS